MEDLKASQAYTRDFGEAVQLMLGKNMELVKARQAELREIAKAVVVETSDLFTECSELRDCQLDACFKLMMNS